MRFARTFTTRILPLGSSRSTTVVYNKQMTSYLFAAWTVLRLQVDSIVWIEPTEETHVYLQNSHSNKEQGAGLQ